MIYFARAGRGPIKIGLTNGIAKKRVASLRTGCPYPLKILAELIGDERHERALHLALREHRVNGEWYRPTKTVLGVMQSAVAGTFDWEAHGVTMLKPSRSNSLRDRIEACGVHKVEIAKRLGLEKRQGLDNWLRRGKVPAEFVLRMERITGIPRGLIRPDIYPGEKRNVAASYKKPVVRRRSR